jgi:hypothetical protein
MLRHTDLEEDRPAEAPVARASTAPVPMTTEPVSLTKQPVGNPSRFDPDTT